MTQGWQQLAACPLCLGNQYQHLYTTRDRHYGIQGWFSIARCRRCSLVFLNPMPDETTLAGMYPETYYSYQDFFKKPSALKELVRKLLLIRIGTKDPAFPAPGRMLDIGCGSGNFLYTMRERGWETYGVELNAQAAALGKECAGLEIFPGNLLDAHFPSAHFDYIRANHSFEHIANPNEVLREIHRILKPSGKLMIGVPNIDGLNAKLFRTYWWYLGAPVHTFNYSVKTLSQMLQKHQFVVERVTYNSDYSGIIGSIQIFLNRNTQRVSTEGRLFRNPAAVTLGQWIAKLFDRFRAGDAIEITCHKAQESV
jgi:SAM-dependent methyltransferase